MVLVVAVAAVAVVMVVAFAVLFLAMALVVLVVVAWRTRCLTIHDFTVTARWSCNLVIRQVEQ
jgi:hypothetical protein